jgi:hypothetical protein
VQSIERDNIQVETLLLSTHCPGLERRIRYLLARCRLQRMERDDIQVAMLSLSTHCPGIERRICYLQY